MIGEVLSWKGAVRSPGDDDCTFVDADFGLVAVWHWMGGLTIGNAFAAIVKDVLRTYRTCAQHEHHLACVRGAGHQSRWDAGDGGTWQTSWLNASRPSYSRSSRPFEGGGVAEELSYIFRVTSDAIGDLERATRPLGIGGLLTVCRVSGQRLITANIGDCRAYIAQNDVVTQITKDHYVTSSLSVPVYSRIVGARADATESLPDSGQPSLHETDLSAVASLFVATRDVHEGKTPQELQKWAETLASSRSASLPLHAEPSRSAPVLLLARAGLAV
jgi:Protein phosphatase 2C